MSVTLTIEQYEALSALACAGALPAKLREITAFLADIEKSNGITRHFLWIQWQEAANPLPPSTSFPKKWPAELRCSIERTDRPIALADVEAALAQKTSRPVTVLVTTDPGGELGWTPLASYFRG